MSSKAWGGRFEAQPEDWVDDFNASIEFDKNLINQDIQGSIAHATMLANQNIRFCCKVKIICTSIQNYKSKYCFNSKEFC